MIAVNTSMIAASTQADFSKNTARYKRRSLATSRPIVRHHMLMLCDAGGKRGHHGEDERTAVQRA